jgi:hypothetical protein
LFVGIPKPIWDALWLGTLQHGEAVIASFIETYGLDIVTIGTGEDAYEAVAPRDGWLSTWVMWSIFILTPSASCIEGCRQVSFP